MKDTCNFFKDLKIRQTKFKMMCVSTLPKWNAGLWPLQNKAESQEIGVVGGHKAHGLKHFAICL